MISTRFWKGLSRVALPPPEDGPPQRTMALASIKGGISVFQAGP